MTPVWRGRAARSLALLLLLGVSSSASAQQVVLPSKPDSVRFAVIGDSGTGGKAQYEVAKQLTAYRAKFPFEFVLMVGDNLYGGERPGDYRKKFELPYKILLESGVKFYAALGNHDNPNQRFYKLFNMGGDRYYTFSPKNGVRFFALDSNYMDKNQLEWVQKQLGGSNGGWKIAFFHHPLYSSGKRHGSAEELRTILEPLLLKYEVSAVFAGHEHFYERLKPQKGIYYFISGAAAKLRRANIHPSELTAQGFDTDNSFMLVEIAGDELHFQTISRTGTTVDSGILQRPRRETQATSSREN